MDHFENIKVGPPQLETHGGFPSEPTKHLGSFRVTNETSKQEVQPEILAKCIKFMFFWDCSIHVLFCVHVFIEFGGGSSKFKGDT